MKVFIVMLFSAFTLAFGQEEFPEKTDDVLLNRLVLREKLSENVQDGIDEDMRPTGQKKSVGRAVLMSAVVPGAGQLYAGAYLKSAIFLAVEAAALVMNISNNNKGDEKTDEFEAFAIQNWSEQRYWTSVYLELKDRPDLEGFPYGVYDNLVQDAAGRMVIPDWQTAEGDLAEFASTRYISNFSHELPATQTQQYYEMIGKYPEQFGNAWADAQYGVAYFGGYGNVQAENITPFNTSYVDMRQEANRFYDRAGYGTMIALVNHVVSAVDAGFSARSVNRRQVKLTYQSRRYYDRYVNLFGLAMAF